MGKDQGRTDDLGSVNETANSIAAGDHDVTPPLVSIIFATYNERENIEGVINAALKNVREPVEIIVVDDNSPDGTANYVRELNNPHVTLIQRFRERGLASAIARGVLESRGKIVGWIDADMPEETKNLSQMIDLNGEYDVVIASRFVDGGVDTRHPSRQIASRLLSWFAKIILGYGINDYGSCIATVRRTVFDDVMIIPYGFGDFFIEFVYGCLKKGFKVYEMPFTQYTRASGTSKSFPNLAGFLWLGFKYIIRILATRFRPD